MIDIKVSLFVSMLALAVVGCDSSEIVKAEVDSSVKTATADTANNSIESELSHNANKTFGITPDEFIKQINVEAEEILYDNDIPVSSANMDLPVGSFITGSAEGVFAEKIGDAIAMIGKVNKNNEIESLTFTMFQTDQGDIEIVNIMIIAGLSAQVLSSESSNEDIAGIVTDMMGKAVAEFMETGNGESSTTINGVKYSELAGAESGFSISLEAA